MRTEFLVVVHHRQAGDRGSGPGSGGVTIRTPE